MILVTGSTGFIGRALVSRLALEGHAVRLFVRPSSEHRALIKGVPLEIAVGEISDPDALTAALVGVDTVFHLVGGEWKGASEDLHAVEVEGSLNLSQAIRASEVKRVFYLSHLGADRASAFPVLKAKGIAEEYIRQSGADFTILRTSLLYGPGDQFTTQLAKLMKGTPFVFPLPAEGKTSLQPIWIEDLITCLVWALDDEKLRNRTLEIGGPEQLSLQEIAALVSQKTGIRRYMLSVQPSLLRVIGTILENFFPGLPLSVYWVDYLAANKTCPLDSIPFNFGLMPARMKDHLEHLQDQPWGRLFWRDFFRRSSSAS